MGREVVVHGLKPRVPKRPSTIDIQSSKLTVRRNELMFDIPQPGEAVTSIAPRAKAKAAEPGKPKRTCDPRLAAAARELRDRWLEQVNAGQLVPAVSVKYDVSRLPGSVASTVPAAVELPGLPTPRAA